MNPATPMRLALAMTFAGAVAAIVLMFLAQKRYGIDDDFRFGTKPTYSVNRIQGWAKTAADTNKIPSDANKMARSVVPILFPIDLMLLACLGSFLALCSLNYSARAGIPPSWAWLVLILPVVYMALDLSENLLLTRMLTAPDLVNDNIVSTTKMVTHIKIIMLKLAAIQTVSIAGWALVARRAVS